MPWSNNFHLKIPLIGSFIFYINTRKDKLSAAVLGIKNIGTKKTIKILLNLHKIELFAMLILADGVGFNIIRLNSSVIDLNSDESHQNNTSN